MKRVICLLVVLLMLLPLVNADITELLLEVEASVRPYVGRELPSPFKGMYGNEVVNIYLSDGTPIGHAATVDGVFARVGQGASEDATMNIYVTNGNTIASIMQAENPLDKFYELKAEGKIKVEPVGFGKKVKWAVTSAVAKIISWFT
ncbi:hypothetical protein KY342_02375 [Candidatus Woesearchaeota archaeon]|nr:hypothetical protein [Candidatus Woesearchaeota archaeon]